MDIENKMDNTAERFNFLSLPCKSLVVNYTT